jgi:hypothetical protein
MQLSIMYDVRLTEGSVGNCSRPAMVERSPEITPPAPAADARASRLRTLFHPVEYELMAFVDQESGRDGSMIGVNDRQILLQLKEGYALTADYIKLLRRELPIAFPDVQFYFQPADLVTQILNFDIPAKIEYQPQLVGAGVAQFLDGPEIRYPILFRRKDSGVPDCQQERSGQYTDRGQRLRRQGRANHSVQCRDRETAGGPVALQSLQYAACLRRLCRSPGP